MTSNFEGSTRFVLNCHSAGLNRVVGKEALHCQMSDDLSFVCTSNQHFLVNLEAAHLAHIAF